MRILFFTSFVLGLALANTLVDAGVKPRFCETEVTAFLTCLQGVLSTGIPEVGLPSLETLTFTDLEIDLNSLGTHALNGNILIRELILKGITGFEMKNLVMKSDMIGGIGFKFGGDLNFAQLSAASKMKLDASLAGKKLSGDGELSIGLSDLNINFLLRIKASDISIKEFKLVPTINDLQFSSKDLMIGDKSLEDFVAQHKQDLKDIFDYLISLIQKPAFLQAYGTPRADILQIIIAIIGRCPIDLSCLPNMS